MSSIALSPIDRGTPNVQFRFFFVYKHCAGKDFNTWISSFKQAVLKLEEIVPFLKGHSDTGKIVWDDSDHIHLVINENYPSSLEENGFKDEHCYEQSNKWDLNMAEKKSEISKRALTIFVNQYTCGGISIQYSFHHQMVDGYGASLILKELSNIMENQPNSYWTFRDRDIIFNKITALAGEAKLENGGIVSMNPEDLANPKPVTVMPVEATMKYLKIHVKYIVELQEEFNDELIPENNIRLSVNDIACALIWNEFIQHNPIENIPWKILFAVDIRREFKDYFGDSYLGNAAIVREAICNIPKKDVTIKDLAIAIRTSLNDMLHVKSLAETLLWMDEQDRKKKIILPNFRFVTETGYPDLLISNWSRFPFYNLTMGLGIPIYAGGPPSEGASGIGVLQPLPQSTDMLWIMKIPNTILNSLSNSEWVDVK